MRKHLELWRRYPYSTGGPVWSALGVVTAVTGIVSVLLLPRGFLWQITPGVVVLYVGFWVGRSGAHRYASRRGRTAQKQERSGRKRTVIWTAAAVIGATTGLLLGLFNARPGWVVVVAATAWLVDQLRRRWLWARRGYPGIPER